MSKLTTVGISIGAATLMGCISSRQALTPEASEVRYMEGEVEPPCQLVEEVTVGREWFVFDERQPAKSHDDVVVRMRRLAAKREGNLVVILENEKPNAKCSGFNGLGRVYQCSSAQLAELDTLPRIDGDTAKAESE